MTKYKVRKLGDLPEEERLPFPCDYCERECCIGEAECDEKIGDDAWWVKK